MVPDKQVCFAKTEDLNTSPKVNWNLKPKTKFKYILNMSRYKKILMNTALNKTTKNQLVQKATKFSQCMVLVVIIQIVTFVCKMNTAFITAINLLSFILIISSLFPHHLTYLIYEQETRNKRCCKEI